MSISDRAVAGASALGGTSPALKNLLPGLFLSMLIAGAAIAARQLPFLAIFSPMILAVIIGVLFTNLVGAPQHVKAGIAFTQRSLLRLAIILLGFQLTLNQVMSIGASALFVIAISLTATFVFTVALGKVLGVEQKLAQLIAAGTSICGASAIVATNSVTRAKDEDVAYAVASITLFGTLAMLVFPLLAPVLGLDEFHFGLWAGASIHEVAQVVGASFQGGPEAGEVGTIAKLARVVFLAPMVIALGLFVSRNVASEAGARPPVPWFVVGFALVVIFNSLVELPAEVLSPIAMVTTTLLTMGLAAMGLQTSVAQFRQLGLRPLVLGAAASCFIACLGLFLVKLV